PLGSRAGRWHGWGSRRGRLRFFCKGRGQDGKRRDPLILQICREIRSRFKELERAHVAVGVGSILRSAPKPSQRFARLATSVEGGRGRKRPMDVFVVIRARLRNREQT